MISVRDVEVLKHILKYCEEIDETMKFFGSSIETLSSISIYKNAVSMCILQIGELTLHLTDNFKITYSGMPWQDIKNMRNIAAHHYGKFDIQQLWDTICIDIPSLLEFCNRLLSEEQ